MLMGCAGIQLRNNWVGDYPTMRVSTSNKGWHSHWFYLKNDAAAPLLVFTGRLIEEAPDSWRKWGVPEKDKNRIQAHLATIRFLMEKGLKGSGIIGAYHARRVAPLMRRPLPLYAMAPGASFDRMTFAEEALSPSEVTQRIKEAMEPSWDDIGVPLDFMYLVMGHPLMRPETGYIAFVSFLSSCLLFD